MPEFSSFGIKALFHVKLKALSTHHIKLWSHIIILVWVSMGFQVCRWQEWGGGAEEGRLINQDTLMEWNGPKNQRAWRSRAGRMWRSCLQVSLEFAVRGITEPWNLDQQTSFLPSFTYSTHIHQAGKSIDHFTAKLWHFLGWKRSLLVSILG